MSEATWRDAAVRSLDEMYERARKAEAERDRYREALDLIARWKDAWDHDEGVRGRSPSQVAREALNGGTE